MKGAACRRPPCPESRRGVRAAPAPYRPRGVSPGLLISLLTLEQAHKSEVITVARRTRRPVYHTLELQVGPKAAWDCMGADGASVKAAHQLRIHVWPCSLGGYATLGRAARGREGRHAEGTREAEEAARASGTGGRGAWHLQRVHDRHGARSSAMTKATTQPAVRAEGRSPRRARSPPAWRIQRCEATRSSSERSAPPHLQRVGPKGRQRTASEDSVRGQRQRTASEDCVRGLRQRTASEDSAQRRWAVRRACEPPSLCLESGLCRGWSSHMTCLAVLEEERCW